MKGFMSFILVCIIAGAAFFAGQSYYEQNHTYISDKGVNINKIVNDTGSGVESLFEDVTSYF